jgi:hypothetical protein
VRSIIGGLTINAEPLWTPTAVYNLGLISGYDE